MNILNAIDDLQYLKLIVYFEELTAEQLELINEYRNKIEILSFNELIVKKIKFNK